MAISKYIANISGKLKEVFGTAVSTGAGDAGKIVALGNNGRLDPSIMPDGISAEVVVGVASENLSAGDFVNFFNNSGTINIRKADATNNTKPAHAFVNVNVTAGQPATSFLISAINSGVAALTPGTEYWLHTTPGKVTNVPPAAAGNIVQSLGVAKSATELPFINTFYYELS